MPLRMRVHDREPIGLALRRFKKLLETKRPPEGTAKTKALREAMRIAPSGQASKAERDPQSQGSRPGSVIAESCVTVPGAERGYEWWR